MAIVVMTSFTTCTGDRSGQGSPRIRGLWMFMSDVSMDYRVNCLYLSAFTVSSASDSDSGRMLSTVARM